MARELTRQELIATQRFEQQLEESLADFSDHDVTSIRAAYDRHASILSQSYVGKRAEFPEAVIDRMIQSGIAIPRQEIRKYVEDKIGGAY